MTQFIKIIPLAALSMLLSTAGMASSIDANNRNPAGHPGTASEVSQDIKVTQVDNMFLPNEIRVTEGETIRFVVINKGDHRHEMVIGMMDNLRKIAKQRRKNPDEIPAEAGVMRLQPGEKGEIIWTFGQIGEIDFACPLPGHFKAMRGKIYVEKK
ncbi:MAG: cupredoxin domain-containing protein [Nitrosomonas sp.]|nr:cupredoxin domain-containing protein [Nitrosomonas sp.]